MINSGGDGSGIGEISEYASTKSLLAFSFRLFGTGKLQTELFKREKCRGWSCDTAQLPPRSNIRGAQDLSLDWRSSVDGAASGGCGRAMHNQARVLTLTIDMVTNRHKFFRWTPRTVWITFVYAAGVPLIFYYMGARTEVSCAWGLLSRHDLTTRTGQVRVQREAERRYDCGMVKV